MDDTPPPATPTGGRDRLRELLDAVLGEDNPRLTDMAGDAYASPFHFSRLLTRGSGESPVAMRRRVTLERAAWQLRQGESVTDVAFTAGYQSVEGFSRAFSRAYGHPPSAMPERPTSHWLPAPNGIHFHSPTALWVDSHAGALSATGDVVTAFSLHHDLYDVRDLLECAKGLDEEEYRRVRLPGSRTLEWDGPDESLAQVLEHLVATKEVWLASIEGSDTPQPASDEPAALLLRHDELAPRWLATMRDIGRRSAWGDRLIDALCDPPESFVLGSVVAHVLTFSAHRRQLARLMLRSGGVEPPDPDPIMWLRRRTEATDR